MGRGAEDRQADDGSDTDRQSPPPCIDSLDELVEAIDHLERLQADVAVATARLDEVGDWRADGAVSMAIWLQHHARLADVEARALVRTGKFLRRFPAVAAAARSRRWSAGQVQAIRRVVTTPLTAVFDEQQEAVVEAVEPLDVTTTEQFAQGWKARAEALVDLPEPTEPERTFTLSVGADGVGLCRGVLDPAAALEIRTGIASASTYDGDDDTRSPGRRRADALVEVFRFFNAHHEHGGSVRNRPHVELVVRADELTGLRRHSHTHDGVVVPPLDTAAYLCDCTISRVVIAGSEIVDHGRAVRTFPLATRRVLDLRDRGCRWPSCDRPPSWCEGHHIVEWERGGVTDVANGLLLCSHHHHLLHRQGWQPELQDDGSVTYTHLDGRRLHDPPPALPDHLPARPRPGPAAA